MNVPLRTRAGPCWPNGSRGWAFCRFVFGLYYLPVTTQLPVATYTPVTTPAIAALLPLIEAARWLRAAAAPTIAHKHRQPAICLICQPTPPPAATPPAILHPEASCSCSAQCSAADGVHTRRPPPKGGMWRHVVYAFRSGADSMLHLDSTPRLGGSVLAGTLARPGDLPRRRPILAAPPTTAGDAVALALLSGLRLRSPLRPRLLDLGGPPGVFARPLPRPMRGLNEGRRQCSMGNTQRNSRLVGGGGAGWE